ncbi:unnamed protein product [Spirodela intermedia]|uniref:Uncharacterized protein n=1 Tax=Spirodela intermedia TaxID=51605 RepID=A0A7I8I7X5_SPIIN|nr:unnamed protein product [Spirodela intermedia]CAA6653679.1 unnamed protein product [Spirodela intermedia]
MYHIHFIYPFLELIYCCLCCCYDVMLQELTLMLRLLSVLHILCSNSMHFF